MENVAFKYSGFFEDDGGLQKAKSDFTKLSDDLVSEAKRVEKAWKDALTVENTEGIAKAEQEINDLVKARIELKNVGKQITTIEAELKKTMNEQTEATSKSAEATYKNASALEKMQIQLEEQKVALKAVNQLEKEGKISIEQATIARNRAKDMMKTLSSEINNQTKLEKAKATIEKEEIGTLAQLRERMSALRLVVQNTSLTTKEGQDTIKAYNKEIDELTEVLSENSDKFIKNKINIGNYEESIRKALGQTTLFGVNLGQVGDNLREAGGLFNATREGISGYLQGLQGLTTAQKASAVASTIFSEALKVLKFALISTGIGAIVVLLGSLVSYFSSTEDGANKLTMILEPLKAIFSALQGVLSDVGRKLVEAFENPKKALSDLYDFLKNNLINRFTAFGVILEGIINLDFKKITDGALQATTGVENLTDKIKATAKATGDILDEAIKKGEKIAQLNIKIRNQQLEFRKATRETNDIIEDQLLISKDTSRSIEDRKKAVDEIIRVTKLLGQQEENIVLNKIKALQLSIANKGIQNQTYEDRMKMEDLLDELDQARDRKDDAIRENQKVISAFRKEQAEKAVKEAQLDLAEFLANQGAKAKSIDEQIGIERRASELKLKVLEREKAVGEISDREFEIKKKELANETFKTQSSLIKQLYDLQVETNEKLNTTIITDSKFVNQELLKAELERIENLKTQRKGLVEYYKQIGILNEEQAKAEIIKINKETEESRTKATEAFSKNRIELRKQEVDEMKKIELDAINERLNSILNSDVSKLSKQARKKQLKEIKSLEKQKLEIERKYKEISARDRITEIDAQIALLEKNSVEEIKLQREKAQILTEIESESQKARIEKLKETNRTSEELYKEFKETVKSVIGEVFKAITTVFQKQVESQQKLLQKQNEITNTQEERAKLGLSNTLAFEQKALAQREADLIKSQKKQQRLEKIKALYSSYSSYAEKEENPGSAVFKALRDFAILEGIVASFGDGGIVNDKLPSDGIFRGQSHKGNQRGIPILVEGREGIFSAQEMENLGRDNFYKMKDIASMGKVDSNFFSRQRKQFVQTTIPRHSMSDPRLIEEMRDVKKAIENQPIPNWQLNKLADGVIETIETVVQKNKTVRNTYKTKKPRL